MDAWVMKQWKCNQPFCKDKQTDEGCFWTKLEKPLFCAIRLSRRRPDWIQIDKER